MSESINNPITFGMKGAFGKLVIFRNRLGRTFAAIRPKASNKPPTEEQVSHRNWFRDAVRYAKAAIKDPQVKKSYTDLIKDSQSAFNVALLDYSGLPEVRTVDVSGYAGVVGNRIIVQAVDNCKVARVHVVIKSAAGVIIEEGDAVMQFNELDWLYTATKANSTPAGSMVNAIAYDLAGNSSNLVKPV